MRYINPRFTYLLTYLLVSRGLRAAGGNGGELWEKVAEGEAGKKLKGNEKRGIGEEGKRTGKGKSALVAEDRRLCQWGPGQSPAEKRILCI